MDTAIIATNVSFRFRTANRADPFPCRTVSSQELLDYMILWALPDKIRYH